MKFRQKTDDNRRLHFNMEQINIYTSRRLPNTEYDIEIKPYKKKKSLPMQKYFFAEVMEKMCQELGYYPNEKEDLHKHMKITYFSIKPDKLGVYRNIPSVFGEESTLPIDGKWKYVEWVRHQAASLGIYTNDPGEKDKNV